MVDPGTLASDVVQNVVYLATPPLLWLFLYLLAWQSPALARATGFGRLAFWLLLPGSLIGTIGNLPFVPISSAVLAINIGGGILPMFLTASLLHREFGRRTDLLAVFAGVFVLETAAALAWVVFAGSSSPATPGLPGWIPLSALGTLAIAVATPVSLFVATRHEAAWRPVTFATALTSVALVATYATTEAAPGVGIISSFPGYLLAPVAVGVLAVTAVRFATGRPEYAGLPLAYGSATLGVLVGADVLHQPPLYAPAANALYSIGGAGLLDLLYLSGLLALVVTFLVYSMMRRLGRAAAPEPGTDYRSLTPAGRVRASLTLLLTGRFAEATREAHQAAVDARAQCRGLLRLPAVALSDHPWAEMGAPPWVDGDSTNLDALARRLDVGARDAWRAHLTARYLVRVARHLSRRRFGTIARRSAAFLIDLALLLLPAISVWWYLSATIGGSIAHVLSSSAFNAAAYGFAAYAFAYFVLAEFAVGATVGKHLLGLRVRDRALRPAPALPVVVRDLPKLIPLTILGFGGAVATLITVRGSAVAGGVTAGVALPAELFALVDLIVFIGFGLLVCGAASLVAIYGSTESQRLGDYLAGTWVIQE
ncbi:MAG TPA: DUF1614 domain-containing protein [Thermoplasmata archaeon]|nr:DUF1614 domain-containing protein [Thermoplasmata archaeon]